jgi:hypothetical protein
MSGTDDRHSFYINLPVGALATAIIFFTFSTPQSQRNHPDRKASAREKFLQMDFPGLVLIVGSIQCLLMALYWGGVSKPWDANDVIGCLLGFGLLLLGLLFIEWQQGPYAMLVHKLLKKREVWSGSAFSFFISGSLFVLVYYLPIYFQAILGCTAIESGIRNLALVVPVCEYISSITLLTLTSRLTNKTAICTILVGGMITLYGHFAPFMIIGSCLATAGAGLISTFDPQSSPGIWIGYQILAGTAFGLAFQAPIMAAQALAADDDVATTTAILYCKPSTLHISSFQKHTLRPHSLPTPRRRHLRLHRRVHLQQHPDIQPADQSPRRRPFGGGSRGRKSQRPVSARNTGTDRTVLHGWTESCVPDGSGSGWLCVVGRLLCALGQYQGESHDGVSVKDACKDSSVKMAGRFGSEVRLDAWSSLESVMFPVS